MHCGSKMAAPSERRGNPASGPAAGPGPFPFPLPGPPGAGAEQQPRKKPCRACTDFRSWIREQRKQTASQIQMRHPTPELSFTGYG
uniref:Uncharacterized protein n=1 Tax=Terrapene triunguis TaxID=2587831 RepID=A0A674JGX4_9SAUR